MEICSNAVHTGHAGANVDGGDADGVQPAGVRSAEGALHPLGCPAARDFVKALMISLSSGTKSTSEWRCCCW